ncbi:hypothetical protein HYPSUDRAFT_205429 [Hypholoma sublateritium FD-334 SS-4]|uniref:Uncharacterized protein n=1 Tax=Hypholoma sublateritium (strain FD-334 SS-4) TaxID=945553 RepID=A0A0D2M553_HYPSF|nr:hypothetical protein HYPSUDRAFT_205429 [Hypholoma sublateritium FD-334 SS-4]
MARRRRRRPSYIHPPTHLVTASTHPERRRHSTGRCLVAITVATAVHACLYAPNGVTRDVGVPTGPIACPKGSAAPPGTRPAPCRSSGRCCPLSISPPRPPPPPLSPSSPALRPVVPHPSHPYERRGHSTRRLSMRKMRSPAISAPAPNRVTFVVDAPSAYGPSRGTKFTRLPRPLNAAGVHPAPFWYHLSSPPVAASRCSGMRGRAVATAPHPSD